MTNNNNAAPNNIIAIASGKGGVGKTWLAITLTHLFARAGRRTLLFDGDIGLANVDIQLGLTPDIDLSAAFSGKTSLKQTITHHEEGNFDIIAGRSGSAKLTELAPSQMENLKQEMQAIAAHYDFVILDLGAGIERNVRFLSSIASQCLVVVTDEPTSLTDAYAFIKLCQKLPNMPSIEIIVNQAQAQKEGEKTYAALNKACVSFLKTSVPCLGVVRKDNKVRDTIRAQRSMLATSPHSIAATDMASLSIKLMQRERIPVPA